MPNNSLLDTLSQLGNSSWLQTDQVNIINVQEDIFAFIDSAPKGIMRTSSRCKHTYSRPSPTHRPSPYLSTRIYTMQQVGLEEVGQKNQNRNVDDQLISLSFLIPSAQRAVDVSFSMAPGYPLLIVRESLVLSERRMEGCSPVMLIPLMQLQHAFSRPESAPSRKISVP